MRAQRQPFQYKGQAGYYADAHTGLYYCHHRYYSPVLARWMSVDPIGLEGGFNVYEYCSGDPVNRVDPSGLDSWETWFGARWGNEPQWFEDMLPLWGSAKRASFDFNRQDYFWGIVNTISFCSDCVAAGAVVKSVGKLGVRATASVGSRSWKTVRSGMTKSGYSKFRGQHFHHVRKQTTIGDSVVLKSIFNQPFMVTGLKESYVFRGQAFSMSGFHQLLDGKTVYGVSMTRLERLVYGTNTFHKALFYSTVNSGFRTLEDVRGIRF